MVLLVGIFLFTYYLKIILRNSFLLKKVLYICNTKSVTIF